ncbi:MAG: hypothetical protein U1E52_16785 [Geminicoccaceae bacterium]
MLGKHCLAFVALLGAPVALAADPPPHRGGWDAASSAAAAAGYCLAKHPYQTLSSEVVAGYTRDGYEVVAFPGVVGAVRRNFVYDRTTDALDEGRLNTCEKACYQFGLAYKGGGRPLHQKIGASTIVTSGIGDMGSNVVKDVFFTRVPPGTATAGLWSRGNSWFESDVAQSDYCCCQGG